MKLYRSCFLLLCSPGLFLGCDSQPSGTRYLSVHGKSKTEYVDRRARITTQYASDLLIDQYKTNIRNKHETLKSHLKAAQLESERNHHSLAKKHFAYVLKRKPTSHTAKHGMAFSLLKMKKTKQAHRYYKKILKTHPTDTVALYNLGSIALETKNLKSAEKYFKKVSRLDSLNTASRFGLVRVFKMKNDYDKAIVQLHAILSAEPKNHLARYQLGLCQRYAGQITNSLASFRVFLDQTKADTSSHLSDQRLLAQAYISEGH